MLKKICLLLMLVFSLNAFEFVHKDKIPKTPIYTLFDLSKKGTKFEIIFKPQRKDIREYLGLYAFYPLRFEYGKVGKDFYSVYLYDEKLENDIRNNPYYPLALDIKIYELTKDGDEILVFDKVATPNENTRVSGRISINIKNEKVHVAIRYLGFYFIPENKTYKAVITNLIDDDNIRGDFTKIAIKVDRSKH
ncbi:MULTISPECIES: hypothetical protein [unclassified Campylobacter]|uniref:hypothetical protein n=1 Tax=unclassified Campylobacter TaxID=2593542 RepID=UPI001DBA6046|nr:hypothetical protein [Campylobacter sp. RM12651]MBZ7991202.1 hypothetical protein [Campylobacter sp. RM9331]MBZ8005695.1 hypothetical protein [Campylobacter sp. RM9332]ULO03069.1 hypothetical protein AVBRAN_0601 [Campylobacter sp. RM12651]